MPKNQLKNLKASEVIRVLKKFGFEEDRQKGSHLVLKKDGHSSNLSIPVHPGKTLGTGLLKAIIKESGISEDDFLEKL